MSRPTLPQRISAIRLGGHSPAGGRSEFPSKLIGSDPLLHGSRKVAIFGRMTLPYAYRTTLFPAFSGALLPARLSLRAKLEPLLRPAR